MILPEEHLILQNSAFLLRSPLAAEGADLARHQYITSEETYFMARYPEEVVTDPVLVARRIARVNESDREFTLSAYLDGEMVANLQVSKIGEHIKFRHRAAMGISIQSKCRGLGLGTAMIGRAIRQTRANGFEQLELGVFEDNQAAIHVYEKLGFQPVGIIPRAFLLKDGSYRNEVQMVLFFF